MKSKRLILLLSALIGVPLLTVTGVIYAGTLIPVGTFRTIEKVESASNPSEKKAVPKIIEAPHLTIIETEKNRAKGTIQPTGPDTIVVQGVNTAATVHVNNFL